MKKKLYTEDYLFSLCWRKKKRARIECFDGLVYEGTVRSYSQPVDNGSKYGCIYVFGKAPYRCINRNEIKTITILDDGDANEQNDKAED